MLVRLNQIYGPFTMTAATTVIATNSSPRDNKRPQLLDAAARHFTESGYEAASMRNIAAAAYVYRLPPFPIDDFGRYELVAQLVPF